MKLTKSKLREIIREEIQKLNEGQINEWVSLQDENYGMVVYFFDFVAKNAESNELKKLAKQGQKIVSKMSKFVGRGTV